MDDIETRFHTKYIQGGENECWNWLAGRNKDGYGRFHVCRFNGFTIEESAHRFMWGTIHGPIPVDLLICHSCDNPRCVNPKHLFLGTVQDNAIDRSKKKRQWQQKKTHCINGHEFSEDNTYIPPGTTIRKCRICRRCANTKQHYI